MTEYMQPEDYFADKLKDLPDDFPTHIQCWYCNISLTRNMIRWDDSSNNFISKCNQCETRYILQQNFKWNPDHTTTELPGFKIIVFHPRIKVKNNGYVKVTLYDDDIKFFLILFNKNPTTEQFLYNKEYIPLSLKSLEIPLNKLQKKIDILLNFI
jgi:hypothetical protein